MNKFHKSVESSSSSNLEIRGLSQRHWLYKMKTDDQVFCVCVFTFFVLLFSFEKKNDDLVDLKMVYNVQPFVFRFSRWLPFVFFLLNTYTHNVNFYIRTFIFATHAAIQHNKLSSHFSSVDFFLSLLAACVSPSSFYLVTHRQTIPK